MDGGAGDNEEDVKEEDAAYELLRDRFRLTCISIAEAEVKKNEMQISAPVVACISDLAFKYTEQLASDLQLFARHAGRKSIRMEDVILSAHRNDHLAASLRSFHNISKAKRPQSDRKRKRTPKSENGANNSGMEFPHETT